MKRTSRTLVLTDLVDSTALTRRVGDGRSAVLFERFDKLTRTLLAEHGGVEIDRTDGFLMTFESSQGAVRFCIALHGGLARLSQQEGETLKVRVGVHHGEVVLRSNTEQDVSRGAKPVEVEGLAKPLAARVMSLAAGGQTLLSGAAREVAHRAAVGVSGRQVIAATLSSRASATQRSLRSGSWTSTRGRGPVGGGASGAGVGALRTSRCSWATA
jgi:class 3 adenylate cyclase